MGGRVHLPECSWERVGAAARPRWFAATGDIGAALAVYRRALAYDSTSPDLLDRVDDLLRQQGTPLERVALYRAALARDPAPARRRELLHTIAFIERNDLQDAAASTATYEGLLAEDPSDTEAVVALSELYADAQRWESLCTLLEGTLAHATSDEARAIRARMAEVALRQGDPEKARRYAQLVLEDAAAGAAEIGVLEGVAAALEDTTMLRAVLSRQAALAPDPAEQVAWLDRLGALELSCAEPHAAVVTWKRAAALAEADGRLDEARRLYERVREVVPDDGAAVAHLADLLERAEDWSKLPELYAIMLARSEDAPLRIGVLMRHARLLAEHLDDMGGALVSAAQAFELASGSSDYREVLSTFTMLALRGKATHIFAQAMDDAIARNAGADSEQAVRRTELRMAKARVLAANREGRDAAVAAYRAILEDPGVAEPQLKSALHAFESLLSSEAPDARRAERRWLLAWRSERATGEEKISALEASAQAEESVFGEPAQALELYRRALALEPENVRVLSAVARLSLGLGDAEGAVAALGAQRDKSEGEARNAIEVELATTYLNRLGRPADALAAVSRVLAVAPDDAGASAIAAKLLANASTREEMAKVLEDAQRSCGEPRVRARILRALLDASADGAAPPDVRGRWYESLLDIQRASGESALAFVTVLAAANEQPGVIRFWDQAEQLARELQRPREVADAYGRALAQSSAVGVVTLLGERGVAFQEEWFEDPAGVVRILERVLEVDPQAEWAFGRLKMIYDAGERWPELFALYDRAIASADDVRKAALYEDAAQIAKDFANDSDRAVVYLEKLLALRPLDVHLVASLERLYERKGAHRELVGLLTQQLSSQRGADAQRTRARIAHLWLDDLKDPDRALAVAEEILRDMVATSGAEARDAGGTDPYALIESVMAVSPKGVPGESDGQMSARYRAAGMLHAHYERAGRDADLARLYEVELEIATSPKERALGHRQIANFYAKIGEYSTALEHVATLALLEPETAAHRLELADLAARIGRHDRLADVLVKVSEKAESAQLRAELMTAAGDVWVTNLRDEERAVAAYLGVMSAKDSPESFVLEAARKVEPLLERAHRAWDLLDVLERLATLEEAPAARARAWTLAARLATSLGNHARAIAAWNARLKEDDDSEALDSLIVLLESESRWPELLMALRRRVAASGAKDSRQVDRVRIARVLQDRLLDLEAAITEWTATEAEFAPTDESTDALCGLLETTARWGELEEKLAQAAARAGTSERRAQLYARVGEVVRVHRGDLERARESYDAALAANPGEPTARAGLIAIARAGKCQAEVVRTLLAAYSDTDDWRETLLLIPLRLEAATTDPARIAILLESSKLAEERGGDAGQAFELTSAAFDLGPERSDVAAELARLAAATGRWAPYTEAHERALARHASSADPQSPFADPLWRAAFRHRFGKVKDTELSDAAGALRVYQDASAEAPADLAIALSTIDVAARTARWGAVAAAVVGVSRGVGVASTEALSAAEQAAHAARAWDEFTNALGREVGAGELPAQIARDLEARLGVWHRDRRGDPDAAEAAFVRALAHDPSSTELLTALANLQRRARGRPLVDSLLRLSQATGGDLELLREAADVAISSLEDRGLAKSILASLIALAETRWAPSVQPATPSGLGGEPEGPVSVGAARSPAAVVRWAILELAEDPRRRRSSRANRRISSRRPRRCRGKPAKPVRWCTTRRGSLATTFMTSVAPCSCSRGSSRATRPNRAAVAPLLALYEAHERHDSLLGLRARLVASTADASERIGLRLSSAQLEVTLNHPDAAIELLRANLKDDARHPVTIATLVGVLEARARFGDLAELLMAQAELAETAGEAGVAAAWWVRAAEVAEAHVSNPESGDSLLPACPPARAQRGIARRARSAASRARRSRGGG